MVAGAVCMPGIVAGQGAGYRLQGTSSRPGRANLVSKLSPRERCLVLDIHAG